MKEYPKRPQRAILSVKPDLGRLIGRVPAAVSVADPRPVRESVPPEAPVSFVLWRCGNNRPSRRHPTLASARAEAARVSALHGGARVHVYELRLIASDDEVQS